MYDGVITMGAKRECVEWPLNSEIKKNERLKDYVVNKLMLKHTFHNCIKGLYDFFNENYGKKKGS